MIQEAIPRNMKHEIIELHDVQIIGMAKKIVFNEAKEECTKFWGEYVERIIKPVFMEHKAPNALTNRRACSRSAESEQAPLCSHSISAFQQAAIDNGVGEFGLCTCDIPNHNCATCWEANFGACSKNTFTYVIGGTYKGGEVPDGMQLFPISSGKWLKVFFEGGMKAFQEQYEKFHKEWLPAHPEYKLTPNSCCMEWYQGTDIQSPDYQCGVMMPLDELFSASEKNNKALVIIDIQNDITKHYRDIIGNINAAIEWAVAERLRLEKNGNACGSMHIVYIKHNNTTAGTRTFKPGSKGEELVPEMKVVSDNIFVKTKSNALTSEAFSAFITANDINEFYVAGADATACVKSTCFNMRKAGFTVHVLSDCVTSYDLKKLPEMLAYYESKGCDIKDLTENK